MNGKAYYNLKNIRTFKNGQWVSGAEAVKEMKLIRSDGGNWDLCQDKRGTIYYISLKSGCNSGIWGSTKHYRKVFKEEIPA